MRKRRFRVLYKGHVQGIGFRFNTERLAGSFEVSGTVKNLPTGDVELITEGPEEEIKKFIAAIDASDFGQFINSKQEHWTNAENCFDDFSIAY